MVSLRFSILSALCTALFTGAVAVPTPAEGLTKRMFDQKLPAPVYNGSVHALGRRSSFGPPYWVVYQDAWNSGETGPPATSAITGYNVLYVSS
jgi:hypothetical protein